MSYDAIKREMTLQEEIENLEVSKDVKDRLLQKLKEMSSKMDKKLCEVSHKQEENFEKYNRIREQNISLKSACFALAAALNEKYDI